ncbi:MAG: hypothetical protein IPP94_16895 [Ignavibacteria bacterium]|nr:hypothetical protein [Ignavibacteria bacterium]
MLLPRAIITIPIYADNEAVAVISLARRRIRLQRAIHSPDRQSARDPDRPRWKVFSLYRKSAKYAGALNEELNNELESQKEGDSLAVLQAAGNQHGTGDAEAAVEQGPVL